MKERVPKSNQLIVISKEAPVWSLWLATRPHCNARESMRAGQ